AVLRDAAAVRARADPPVPGGPRVRARDAGEADCRRNRADVLRGARRRQTACAAPLDSDAARPIEAAGLPPHAARRRLAGAPPPRPGRKGRGYPRLDEPVAA